MYKVILPSLMLLTVGLVACSGPAAFTPAPPWVPLTVGNWWLYDVDGMLFEGPDTTLYTYQMEVRITDLVEHQDGFQVYEERFILHFNEEDADTFFYYLYQTDFELRGYSSLAHSSYNLELSYPLELGKTWYFEEDSIGSMEREVVSISQTENTPAGLFSNCAVVKEAFGLSVIREFSYSAGNGCVGSSSTSDYASHTNVLHSYNVQ